MADPTRNVTEDPHLEMMGDETEEQNLNQPGHPEKRIKEDEVQKAFGGEGKDKREGGEQRPH
jgi:hypothetical protein